MRLLVLEHQADAPAGLLGDWASERGHEMTVTRVAEASVLPEPRDGDVLVSLGSDHSLAGPREDWIDGELEVLRRAHDAGRPVLGICFGGQALAAALGGEVRRAPRVAIEWSRLDTQRPDLVGGGPWFRWHEDEFSVPDGAQQIARAGDVAMAFVSNAAVGLQFHPEVTAPIAEQWIAGAGRQLATAALEEGHVRERISSGLAGAPERAYELFDALARLWQEQGLV